LAQPVVESFERYDTGFWVGPLVQALLGRGGELRPECRVQQDAQGPVSEGGGVA
jgi:hypothetical protein